MATQLGDTLTTREAVRRAALEDLVTRAEIDALPMESGPLEGLQVVSMGRLRELQALSLQVDLPPASEEYAEVKTPATIAVDAICPECGEPVDISVKLVPRLVVEGNTTELGIKAKTKAVIHMHGQQRLPREDGQVAAFDGNEAETEPATADSVHRALFEIFDDQPGTGRLLTRAEIEAWDDVVLELVADWCRFHGAAGLEPELPVELADVDAVEAPPALEASEASEADPDALQCDGSNHVPGCEHFPDISKRAGLEPAGVSS